MAYEISLDRDKETGLDRYTIVLGEDFGRPDSGELSEWLLAAAQNPTVTFTVDTSSVRRIEPELESALSVVGAEKLVSLGDAKA